MTTKFIKQRGFTLIELMSASAAVGVIMLAGSAFMIRAFDWFHDVSAKIEMNRHARITYNLWAYGGKSASNGKDNTKNVYGIRGRQKAPDSDELRISTGALKYENNELTLSPDRFASMSVKCKGTNNPIPDCTGLSTKTVTGWLGDDVIVDKNVDDIGKGWSTVTFTITNPYQAQRANSGLHFTDTYRTVFAHNRMEDDPS